MVISLQWPCHKSHSMLFNWQHTLSWCCYHTLLLKDVASLWVLSKTGGCFNYYAGLWNSSDNSADPLVECGPSSPFQSQLHFTTLVCKLGMTIEVFWAMGNSMFVFRAHSLSSLRWHKCLPTTIRLDRVYTATFPGLKRNEANLDWLYSFSKQVIWWFVQMVTCHSVVYIDQIVFSFLVTIVVTIDL